MKKSVLTFCTVLLLATQAPVANAEEVSEKAKVNYFQSVSEYRLKVNALFKMQWSVKKVAVTEQAAPKETIEEVKQPTHTTPKETTVETKQEAPKAPTQEVKQEAPKAPTQEVKQEAPKAPTQEVKQEAPKAPTQEVKQEAPKAPAQEVKQEAPKAPAQVPTESVTKAEPVKQVTPAASDIDVIEQQVVELTNKERAKYSLPALAMDKPLMAAAREKSKDMQVNNYFSHTSPTYGSPFDRLKALGISYRSAGENIAKGQTSAAQVVEAWMNSEGHRANILNKDFTHIGVGYVKQGHVWTQQFIKK
ncbi:CAP domain-containing protein [Solibacillus sp. FSL H8-0523]|uniref:CAP domain-containing protein n=1 Tax=Solibacillus sp. FSL H8-0523 TaxID=2954511 RepID=UPI0031011A01